MASRKTKAVRVKPTRIEKQHLTEDGEDDPVASSCGCASMDTHDFQRSMLSSCLGVVTVMLLILTAGMLIPMAEELPAPNAESGTPSYGDTRSTEPPRVGNPSPPNLFLTPAMADPSPSPPSPRTPVSPSPLSPSPLPLPPPPPSPLSPSPAPFSPSPSPLLPSPSPLPPPPFVNAGAPGLEDVCAHLSDAAKCSPEICSPLVLRPYARVQLQARTYFQDRQIQLPEGAALVGMGVNQTYIVSCGPPSSGRRGLLLGNNSYMGHFTWQGLQATRGDFDSAIGTPGCLPPNGASECSGGCIPAGGDCRGVENATAEHIHVSVYEDGRTMWPLSTTAGWFPKTVPWGPTNLTGSRNITIRAIVAWGTWADGILFHGGHHEVLIERCEMSFTGDDPYGLWPVSSDAAADASSCQADIVVRNNTARWPRQYQNASRAGHRAPRDFPVCDCSDAPPAVDGPCYGHACYATYAGGRGIQWVNNRCEGALQTFYLFIDFSNPAGTVWCGRLSVAGNTYAAMPGQGAGCRQDSDASSMCSGVPQPPGTIGGQCTQNEEWLPPPCDEGARFASCRARAGVGGACFNSRGPVHCLTATELAESGRAPCPGYTGKCTLY